MSWGYATHPGSPVVLHHCVSLFAAPCFSALLVSFCSCLFRPFSPFFLLALFPFLGEVGRAEPFDCPPFALPGPTSFRSLHSSSGSRHLAPPRKTKFALVRGADEFFIPARHLGTLAAIQLWTLLPVAGKQPKRPGGAPPLSYGPRQAENNGDRRHHPYTAYARHILRVVFDFKTPDRGQATHAAIGGVSAASKP